MPDRVLWKTAGAPPNSCARRYQNVSLIAGLFSVSGVGSVMSSPFLGLSLIGLAIVLLLVEILRTLALLADASVEATGEQAVEPDPSPPPRRRCKWRHVLGLVLLLTVGLGIGWIFRPLNSTEAFLVGRWRTTNEEIQIEFRSDRSATINSIGIKEPLRWRCNQSGIFLETQLAGVPLKARLWKFFKQLTSSDEASANPLQIIDDNTIRMVSKTYHRVPTP